MMSAPNRAGDFDRFLRDAQRGVRALDAAVETLASIARLGGAPGDLAVHGLKRIRAIMEDSPEQPTAELHTTAVWPR